MGVLRKTAFALAATLGGMLLTSAGFAESFPYSNDFSSVGLLNENLDEHWNLDGSNGTFDMTVGPAAGNVVSTSSIELTGIGSNDFVMKTRFTLVNEVHMALTTSSMGFGAFGSSNTFLSTGGNSFYLVDWFVNPTATNGGTLRILAQGDTADFTAVNGDSDGEINGDSIIIGNTYELVLTGIQSGGSLDMTLALFDSAGAQLGTTATATDTSPLTGTFFGYRNRTITTFTLDVAFDSFSVEAPEEGLLGDYNDDGAVDAADYVVWRKFNETSTQLPNDPNPLPIDGDQYNTWLANFGQADGTSFSTASHASNASVPEPAALPMLLLAITKQLVRRRRLYPDHINE